MHSIIIIGVNFIVRLIVTIGTLHITSALFQSRLNGVLKNHRNNKLFVDSLMRTLHGELTGVYRY